LRLLIGDPRYAQNHLRQDRWRAGHAHAGALFVLSLIALRFVDEANLSNTSKWIVRHFIPLAAILLPASFFFSVLSPGASELECFHLSGLLRRGFSRRGVSGPGDRSCPESDGTVIFASKQKRHHGRKVGKPTAVWMNS
jgi:hypothetical protein